MKAFIHSGKQGLENTFFTEMEDREPKEGEVKVRVKAAGLNHRDIWSLYRRGEWALPVILGSDGAGIVHSVGDGVSNVNVGDVVIINPSLNWIDKSPAPPEQFEVLGVPSHGTFAEYIVIPSENIELKPKYLSWEEAGVLPVAGLTAYRALFTRGNLQPNQTVLIPGIGSGVAVFLLLMAKTIGAKVIVTSRSKEKCQKAMELGADLAIDSESDWKETLQGEKVDLVVDGVGIAVWKKSLSVLKNGGTLVNFGATSGQMVEIDLKQLYFGQYNLLGTTLGSRQEFQEMLAFLEKQKIKPIIDQVYSHKDTKKAFEYMNDSAQFGKICIRI